MNSSHPSSSSSVMAQLKADYARFPENQTYSLYAENVQFKDPMNSFSGVQKYRKMIDFLSHFFRDIQMDLHSIEQQNPTLITTQWTLHMTAPVPWSARISIPGRSELSLSETDNLITSHVDVWDCSKWAVLTQLFQP